MFEARLQTRKLRKRRLVNVKWSRGFVEGERRKEEEGGGGGGGERRALYLNWRKIHIENWKDIGR
jgi:hypothetical protein